ncbi:Cadherin-like protein [Moelleriella libera RCEF 2490]|uniref:Cadherin-like protein n=1 Tax=Moelleriella libera RCEF 2490 TaxID=1081109 RepID=A0A166V936_9HYPO|nr:Cadherin-like protein [Moelleriella libera RCEF 2490]
MPLLLVALALLPLSQLASCQPTLSFPFNAQLPLAARIDQFFSYSFSPYTFQSDSTISYSLGEHPSWVSIDSGGRRLYGTPRDGDVPPGDVVGQTVDIVATDAKGSTSMKATLVISRQPAPQVHIPLDMQIDNFGNFSAPSSILSYPSTNFKFSFDQDTFGKPGLNYYATSGDSSPLPAWVKFDGPSLTMSGQTPPIESLVQPPHSFDFSLVASDIVGFSASSLKFSIVVGSHKLTTDHPVVALNATRGSRIDYDGLQNGIRLDGKQVSAGDLTVELNSMPSWLSFDRKTWKLEGTPKDGDRASNFTISFKDGFSDNLDVLMVINVATGLFGTTIEDLKIRPGSDLDIDLAKYFRNPGDVTIEVTTSPNESWLKADGLKLVGRVPRSSKGSFSLFIDASSKSTDAREKEIIDASFLSVDGTTASVTSASSATMTSTPPTATQTDDSPPDGAALQPSRLTTGEILLATIIPVIFVAVLLMILICYFRRRRTSKGYLGSKYRSKISNPVFGTLRVNGSDPSMRDADSMHGAFVQTETLVFKSNKTAFPEDTSPASTRRRSSETLGQLSGSEMPHSIMVDAARTTTVRSVSNVSSEDGRQSWVTIEGGNGGRTRSDRSSRSHRSGTTSTDSTRQVFPGADISGRSRREPVADPALPPLVQMPRAQPTPFFANKSHRSPLSYHSVSENSAITSSSAALPHMDDTAKYTTAPSNKWATVSTARDASEPNWVTLGESEAGGSVSELQRPIAAALAGSRGLASSSGKSAGTELSFGSSENWRIIGRHSPTKMERSYRDLVDEAPFHPSRPSTAQDGIRSGEQEETSAGLVPPIHWREDVPAPLATRRLGPTANLPPGFGLSGHDVHMSGGRGQGTDRDHSGNISDGSFKVFL